MCYPIPYLVAVSVSSVSPVEIDQFARVDDKGHANHDRAGVCEEEDHFQGPQMLP